MGKVQQKEVYTVTFANNIQAFYWRVEFINKFANEVVSIDKFNQKVEMKDSIWYFFSESDIRSIQGRRGQILPQEAIYIILDDIERTKLDSYEGV